jgi:hypothetical protein
MSFLRKHWFDMGLILVIPIGIYLWFAWRHNPLLGDILWINAVALLIHHFEEHRFPGKMYRLVTHMLFHKNAMDDDVAQSNVPLVINVLTGWTVYFMAAIFGGRAIWLGIAAMMISAGNFLAHTIFLNWKENRKYNPGMISALSLFLPVSVWFFIMLIKSDAASRVDWIAGITLGIILNLFAMIELFEWFKAKIQSFLVKKMV